MTAISPNTIANDNNQPTNAETGMLGAKLLGIKKSISIGSKKFKPMRG